MSTVQIYNLLQSTYTSRIVVRWCHNPWPLLPWKNLEDKELVGNHLDLMASETELRRTHHALKLKEEDLKASLKNSSHFNSLHLFAPCLFQPHFIFLCQMRSEFWGISVFAFFLTLSTFNWVGLISLWWQVAEKQLLELQREVVTLRCNIEDGSYKDSTSFIGSRRMRHVRACSFGFQAPMNRCLKMLQAFLLEEFRCSIKFFWGLSIILEPAILKTMFHI